MLGKRELIMKLNRILGCLAVGVMFWACSGDDVAGGSSGDAGITAVKDWEVAGVSQKGPFVTGSAVTVQELDGITLKQTGKSFKGTIKSDKGDFAIKDINLQSQYAILEASGYYRDEISGKKSSGTVTLRALTDLSNRKTVNINLLTHLEYERVMYLVTEKKKSIAEAKEQAEKEILATFGIEGDFAESEDLNIFKSGDGNAALLAVSVLMQSDVDVAGLTERMGEFSIALAEGGSWDDADTKTAIADWASDVDLKGTIANVRKNVENWKYADSVPAFEKFVTNFWWDNYGLGVCNDKRENETKRNINKLSKLYDKYFVCEKGRWVIPGDAKSSSSKIAKSSSSGTAKSSSSVYNPFNSSASRDSLSELPSELKFFDAFCSISGPMIYGNGEQRVWTCTSWANVHDTTTRDSAASALVDSLSAKGFAFEKTMLSDSLKLFYLNSFCDSLSYIYSVKKNDVVYKIAMTKTLSPVGLGYGAYMFDAAIFVMKKGFEDLPIHISSSSSKITSSSSSSSIASSSSIYNPFETDTIPHLPAELSFLDTVYERASYMDMGGGQQKVWFYTNNFYDNKAQDSAASALVKILGNEGFSFEGAVRNDSLRMSNYDDTSYVYANKKDNIVYKVALTKKSYCYYRGLDVKVVIVKAGFEELPTNISGKDSLPDKLSEMFFLKKFIKQKKEYTEYGGGKQIVWRGETSACGSGCDSLIEELIGDAKGKGFVFSRSYSNDSLDNDYTEDSQVYTNTSNGKVYSLVITKGDTYICNECVTLMGTCSPSGMYYIKIIARDADFDEIPTEKNKDYNSPKYREIPEDLKFILDVTDHNYRTYSNDSLRTTWFCSDSIGWGNERLDDAMEKAEELASVVEAHGFTLKSQEEHTLIELKSMGYNTNYYDKSSVTLYRFEKDVAGYHYVADVFPALELHTDNWVGTTSFLVNAVIQISIYDK